MSISKSLAEYVVDHFKLKTELTNDELIILCQIISATVHRKDLLKDIRKETALFFILENYLKYIRKHGCGFGSDISSIQFVGERDAESHAVSFAESGSFNASSKSVLTDSQYSRLILLRTPEQVLDSLLRFFQVLRRTAWPSAANNIIDFLEDAGPGTSY
jgi:hypothetical protein